MATINIRAGTSADDINSLIRRAAGALGSDERLVVKLAAGTYDLDKPIQILHDNVSLLGAGDRTILRTTASDGNAQAVKVYGSSGKATPFTTLKADANLDATTFTLNSVKGLSVGTVIRIEEKNTAAYFKKTGNAHLDPDEMNRDGNYLRTMLAKVTKIDGNKITIDLKAPYAFDKTAQISVPKMLKGVEVGNLHVTSDLRGTPDPYNETNRYKDFDLPEEGNQAISVFAAVGLKMHDISTENTGSTAFSFAALYGSTISNLKVDGAWNKGEDGNGYAYTIKTAFNNVFENLTDEHMRTSMLFGPFSAEHYNQIEISSTDKSINFHGSPDSRNIVLIDRMVLDYGPSKAPNGAVSVGNPKLHPKSTVEDNDVRFKYVLGSAAIDEVRAADSGAVMRTFGNWDILRGGNGKDLLDGGSDPDTLTGGKGSDTFVFRRGYAYDTVTDFTTGSSGDTLDLSNTGITSRAGLSARQIGQDTVLGLGGGDTVTLKGVSAREYDAMKINFSEATTKGVSLAGLGLDTGFSGTNGSDTFSLVTTYLETEKLDFLGMKGTDTLRFTSGKTFDSSRVGRAVGIDTIDLTAAKNKATVTVDKAFAGQADNDSVTVKFNKLGLFLATTGITDWDAVKVSGSGTVATSSKGAVFSSAGGALDVAGGNGADRIKGASAADSIDGGGGADRIMGGGGGDDLWGGYGEDRFVYASLRDSGTASGSRDTIHDFFRGYDQIDLSLLDADSGVRGDQAMRFVTEFTKASSGQADGQVKAVSRGSDTYVYVDGNGDNMADMTIFLDGVKALSKDDFIL
jgi:Ca2+-binding RTX toxin-like protein